MGEIYFKGVAILVYSDQQTKDYREDNVTVTISKAACPERSAEELENMSWGRVLKAGDIWIVVTRDIPRGWMKDKGMQPIVARFQHAGFSYTVTGIEGQMTEGDIVAVVANMKPVGPMTMRIV